MNRQGKKTLTTNSRHYITVQRLQKTADGEGGFIETWYDLKSFFASFNSISEKQLFEYRSINVETTHICKFNGLIDNVTEVDRIYFKERYFEILTIADIQERGFEILAQCKEISVSGDESQTTTSTTTTAAP